MIKTIVGLTLLGATVCALAQGTVRFNNGVTGVVDAPVSLFLGQASLLEGTDWTAQIWAAPGANAAWSSLAAASPTTTFRTGAAAGYVVPVTATLNGVAKDAAVATLQLRVWESKYPTWEQGLFFGYAGASALFNVYAIGGDLNTPTNLVGLQAFALLPEPSLSALLVWGAAIVFSRRSARR